VAVSALRAIALRAATSPARPACFAWSGPCPLRGHEAPPGAHRPPPPESRQSPRRRYRAALAKRYLPPWEPPSARKDNLRFSTSPDRFAFGEPFSFPWPLSRPGRPRRRATRALARFQRLEKRAQNLPTSGNRPTVAGRRRNGRPGCRTSDDPAPALVMAYPLCTVAARAVQRLCKTVAESTPNTRDGFAAAPRSAPDGGRGTRAMGGWGLSVPRNPARYRLPITGSRRSPGRLNRLDQP